MIREIHESLKSATPYMLRNDGKLLTCGVAHPYIKYILQDPDDIQIKELFKLRYDDLLWFYKNTSKTQTKRDIDEFTSAIVTNNYYDFDDNLIKKIKSDFRINDNNANKYDVESQFKKLNDETNQEFCRVRTSNIRWGGSDGSIYFRISSVHFNWFDLIWTIVYNNRQFITTVNICKDVQSVGGRLTFYVHAGKVMQNLSVDDFINLSGGPVIESIYKDSLGVGFTLEESLGPKHPIHIHRCFKMMKESYFNDNFK